MFCKRWRPEELLPKADQLAALLLQNGHVTGVALTGSLARLEPKIHNIDLIVFHDGSLRDGSAPDPPGPAEYDYEDSFPDSFPLDTAFVIPEWSLVRYLRQTSSGTPVNYIFVKETVLFDCAYLQALEAKEKFRDFYRRVFCDIPLILLRPAERRGLLRERISVDPDVLWFGGFVVPRHILQLIGLSIAHCCTDPRCKPRESWTTCRWRIKLRKFHWWHPFMTLFGR